MSTFPLSEAYQQEAQRILGAWDRARMHHSVKDISTCGDEVECAVRDFLKRRLPKRYHVGHGHIVDSALNTSPQLDVVVADDAATPILLEAENGTQYLPFESVYLYGEVKSSYSKSKEYIRAFCSVNEKIRRTLQRQQTPPNYLGMGITMGHGMKSSFKYSHQNPLFSFMFFVDRGDCSVRELRECYSTIAHEYLPTVVCFLDGLLIAKAQLSASQSEISMGSFEVESHEVEKDGSACWTLATFPDKEKQAGQVLGFLMLSLMLHLNHCRLLDPPMHKYISQILKTVGHSGSLLDFRKMVGLLKEAKMPIPDGVEAMAIDQLLVHFEDAEDSGGC